MFLAEPVGCAWVFTGILVLGGIAVSRKRQGS
jgi:hypothetical protein